MILLYSISFIYYKIYITALIFIKLGLLYYLLIIDNINIISSWAIIIVYSKDFIANKYQNIILKEG